MVVSHHDQLVGCLGILPKGSGGPYLSIDLVYLKKSSVSFHHFIGKPAIFTLIIVICLDHCHQVANPCVPGDVHLRGPIDQRWGCDHRRVVVDIQDNHPDSGIALQRGIAPIFRQDFELKGLGLFMIEGPQGIDISRVGVDGDISEDRHVPDLGGHNLVGDAAIEAQLIYMSLLIVDGTTDCDEATLRVDLEELSSPVRDIAVERVEHLPIGALIRVRGVEADDWCARWGIFRHADSVGRLLEEWVVVIGVDDADAKLHCAKVGRVSAIQRRDHITVVGLGLTVQALLYHQLSKARAISPRLGLQPKEVVGGDLIALHSKAARVRVVGTLQWDTGAGAGGLRDLQLDLVSGEAGRVVVEVLDLQLDHADLHGAGHHLQRDDALGTLPAQQVPVDLLLGDQQPRPGVDIHQVGRRVGDHSEGGGLPRVYHETGVPRVLGDVGDHGAGPLLLLHRVLEVDEGAGAGPKQGGPQQRRESPHR
uniref:Uncharacterized protein n=1 Tax=Gallus gallus TaxID=9031 RepID=A0A8V0YZX0_CHICK